MNSVPSVVWLLESGNQSQHRTPKFANLGTETENRKTETLARFGSVYGLQVKSTQP